MRLTLIPAAAAAAAAATLALAGGTAHAAVQPPVVTAGTLTITGDDAGDVIEIRRKVTDETQVEVDVGDDGVVEGTFFEADFTKIAVSAGGGDDVVRIDEAGQPDPLAVATIDGGSGDDDLNGGPDPDVITGGIGNDTIDGDRGNDVQQGQNDADVIRWDPGDGNDVVDGGAGNDVHRFNGANNPTGTTETISVKRSATDADRIELLRNLANIDMDIVSTETIEVVGKGGADAISGGDDLNGLTKLRLFGGDPADAAAASGDDLLTGSDSDDLLSGGDGTDVLNGKAGNDVVGGGAGFDTLSCGGQVDDVVERDELDTVNDDCFVDPPKVDPPKQEDPKVEQPKVEQPKVEQPKADSPAVVAPVLRSAIPAPAVFLGRPFAVKKVTGRFPTLNVTVANTSSRAIDVLVAASDGGYRYRSERRRIVPGQTYTVSLQATKALRKVVARKARRAGVVRRPVVRVVDLATNESLSVVRRLRVAKGAR